MLEALEEEPRSLRDLQQLVGVYAPTAMRSQLRPLTDLEIVIRRPQPDISGLKYELGPAGIELLEIEQVLRDWLADSPNGRIEPESLAAKGTVKALVEGWDSKIIRALAARPRCLTDLDALIPTHSYPALDRRFSALRDCGLIEPRAKRERSTLYGPTRWLQRAGGPLMAAAQWERRHAIAEIEGERFDFEAVFLLATLGRTLPDEVSGRCRLGVEFRNGSRDLTLTGIQLRVVDGNVLSCVARPEGDADASASGSPAAWVRALTGGDPADLYLSGDRHLTREVVEALHRELFGFEQAV